MPEVVSKLTTVAFIAIATLLVFRTLPTGQRWRILLGRWRISAAVAGIVCGALAVLSVFGLLYSRGYVHNYGNGRAGSFFVVLLVSGAFSAFAEEFVFRAVFIQALLRLRAPAWSAVLSSAVIFGLAHLGNPNATWLSVLSTAFGGAAYALAYLGSRGIWFGTGMHLGWNAAQAMLGIPVSGFIVHGLLRVAVVGPPMLTGGAYGIEGGLLGLLGRGVELVSAASTFAVRVWHDPGPPLPETSPDPAISRSPDLI